MLWKMLPMFSKIRIMHCFLKECFPTCYLIWSFCYAFYFLYTHLLLLVLFGKETKELKNIMSICYDFSCSYFAGFQSTTDRIGMDLFSIQWGKTSTKQFRKKAEFHAPHVPSKYQIGLGTSECFGNIKTGDLAFRDFFETTETEQTSA